MAKRKTKGLRSPALVVDELSLQESSGINDQVNDNILSADKLDDAIAWLKRVSAVAFLIGGLICAQYFIANNIPFPLALSTLMSTFVVMGTFTAIAVVYLFCLLFMPTFAQTGGMGKSYPLFFINRKHNLKPRAQQISIAFALYALPNIAWFFWVLSEQGWGVYSMFAFPLWYAMIVWCERSNTPISTRGQIFGAFVTICLVGVELHRNLTHELH